MGMKTLVISRTARIAVAALLALMLGRPAASQVTRTSEDPPNAYAIGISDVLEITVKARCIRAGTIP